MHSKIDTAHKVTSTSSVWRRIHKRTRTYCAIDSMYICCMYYSSCLPRYSHLHPESWQSYMGTSSKYHVSSTRRHLTLHGRKDRSSIMLESRHIGIRISEVTLLYLVA